MHDDVDCYDGLVGPKAIMTQCRRFSEYTSFQRMDLLQYEIAESGGRDTDGLVKICASGAIHTRLLRETLIVVFPHILAHEELYSRLVGQRIVFPITMQLIFNSDGKVCVFRELPSLFAQDECDDDARVTCVNASVLPIDLAELFKF